MNVTEQKLQELIDYIHSSTKARQGIDFAFTLKEGEVHAMCGIQGREMLVLLAKNFNVHITTLHTYIIGA